MRLSNQNTCLILCLVYVLFHFTDLQLRFKTVFVKSLEINANNKNNMVHLHGNLKQTFRVSPRFHYDSSKQPSIDPSTLTSSKHIEESVSILLDWFEKLPTSSKSSSRSNVVCITGAGLSTESGIPDYRGFNGSYKKGHKPMIHDEFMRYEHSRQRYWGRSLAGYSYFSSREPNGGHYALTQMEHLGKIGVSISEQKSKDGKNKTISIITQNVDYLHQESGSNHVIELHGRGKRLVCMHCGTHHCRHEFHEKLEYLNQNWIKNNIAMNEPISNHTNSNENGIDESNARPDGDANLSEETDYSSIIIPSCPNCNHGILKPDVVFFGDNVPKQRVESCFDAIRAADGILCIGSSLEVYSAYRFVKAAAKENKPIAILNIGETRAERENHLFTIPNKEYYNMKDTNQLGTSLLTKIESPIGKTLQALVARMRGSNFEE